MKTAFLAASLAALAVPVVAQATGAALGTKATAHKTTVQKGKKKPQQKHISHSVHNRKRTADEAANLERNEAGAEERDMGEDNRGRLTSTHKAKLQHQQNHAAQAIDHKKHTAVVASAHAKTAPGSRPQQHRTAQLKTGQLTTRQGAHLETKETSLHHEIQRDREQDARKLTPEDQANPQNKNTNQIHLKEHNARMF